MEVRSNLIVVDLLAIVALVCWKTINANRALNQDYFVLPCFVVVIVVLISQMRRTRIGHQNMKLLIILGSLF